METLRSRLLREMGLGEFVSEAVDRLRMGGSSPSLSLAHSLLQEIRQGIRRVEVGTSSGTRGNDSSWTTDALEVSTAGRNRKL